MENIAQTLIKHQRTKNILIASVATLAGVFIGLKSKELFDKIFHRFEQTKSDFCE